MMLDILGGLGMKRGGVGEQHVKPMADHRQAWNHIEDHRGWGLASTFHHDGSETGSGDVTFQTGGKMLPYSDPEWQYLREKMMRDYNPPGYMQESDPQAGDYTFQPGAGIDVLPYSDPEGEYNRGLGMKKGGSASFDPWLVKQIRKLGLSASNPAEVHASLAQFQAAMGLPVDGMARQATIDALRAFSPEQFSGTASLGDLPQPQFKPPAMSLPHPISAVQGSLGAGTRLSLNGQEMAGPTDLSGRGQSALRGPPLTGPGGSPAPRYPGGGLAPMEAPVDMPARDAWFAGGMKGINPREAAQQANDTPLIDFSTANSPLAGAGAYQPPTDPMLPPTQRITPPPAPPKPISEADFGGRFDPGPTPPPSQAGIVDGIGLPGGQEYGSLGEMAGAWGQSAVKAVEGLISSPVPGRTDQLPISVGADSYVMPADVVSGLGQGNTDAGANVLDKLLQELGHAPGANDHIPPVDIIAAGGEYVIDPATVKKIGKGDPAKGHKILDGMVKSVRMTTAKRMMRLPGPRSD